MKKEILESIAPCGLYCSKCFAFTGGKIRRLSKELRKVLGNFDIYAERFETLVVEPGFKLYPDFKIFLEYLTEGGCGGCREEQCKMFKQCGVRACHQEKNVDFCYECNEFPCKNHNFDPHLERRWLATNNEIKEIGIEEFYQKTKDASRYI